MSEAKTGAMYELRYRVSNAGTPPSVQEKIMYVAAETIPLACEKFMMTDEAGSNTFKGIKGVAEYAGKILF